MANGLLLLWLSLPPKPAAGTLVLAPQAMGFELLAVALRALGRIALLLALLLLVLLLLLDLLLRFIALFVAVLDYLLGDALAAEAERYGRGQGHPAKQDEERRCYKLRGYSELGQGSEGRKHDDAVLRDAADDVAPCGPPDYSCNEVGQQSGEHEDQDRRYDLRDVGYELRQNVRDRRDPQGVHGHRDGDEEDQPEYELAQDRQGRLVGLGPVEELLYAPALHPALKAHALEHPGDDALQDLGDDEADDEDDDGADERRKRPRMAPSPSDSDCVTACILAPYLSFACGLARVGCGRSCFPRRRQ